MRLTEVFAKKTYRQRMPRLPSHSYKMLPKVGQWVALLLTFEDEEDTEPHFMTGQVRERDNNQITLDVYCEDIMEATFQRKDIHQWKEIDEIEDCSQNWEDFMKMFNLNPHDYVTAWKSSYNG